MSDESLEDYFHKVLDWVRQETFGKRDAPTVRLINELERGDDGGLKGMLEVYIRTKNGYEERIRSDEFSGLKSREAVDDLFAESLSRVLAGHKKWPR